MNLEAVANITRKNMTDEYLRWFSTEHLWYETKMVFDAGFLLDKTGFNSENREVAVFMRNAVVELFPLHLRNMIDFFYPRQTPPQPTDVIAADYCPAAALPANFPSPSVSLIQARTRCDKEVSHLTTLRKHPSDTEKPWKAAPYLTELALLIRELVGSASPLKLNSEYVARTTQLLKDYQY